MKRGLEDASLEVSPGCEVRCKNFLEFYLPNLREGKKVSGDNARLLFEEFVDLHKSAVLGYGLGLDNRWDVWNYGFKDLAWLPCSGRVCADKYNITGHDLTVIDGDRGGVVDLREGRIIAVPKLFFGKLKGILYLQKQEHCDCLGLLIGSRNDGMKAGSLEMPRFWEGRTKL